MILNVYDMDGTVVDSTAAIRECQLDGLERVMAHIKSKPGFSKLTREDFSYMLDTQGGLKGTLFILGMDQDEFFKVHYKTFDPFEASKNGTMKLFSDAWIYAQNELANNGINSLVSNSQLAATYNKLYAVNSRELFKHVFAQYEKAKSKPTPFMAEQLRDTLSLDGTLSQIELIRNIGDMPVDMEFGLVMHDVLSTAAKRNIPFENYFVNRNGVTYDSMPKGVEQIKQMIDIYRGK